jgi:hypothetical protein
VLQTIFRFNDACIGGNGDRKKRHEEVRQKHHRERQEVHGIHGRGTSCDAGARSRAKGGSRKGGRGESPTREDRRDAESGPRHRQAAPCDRQSQRAHPRAENLVRDAKDGKVVCYFQSADKFKSRYATFGFSDEANLDEGAMWPTSFALKELTATEEARIVALLKKAVS